MHRKLGNDTILSEMLNHLFNALIALVFGFIGAAIWSFSGLADARTESYLIENPEFLPKVAEAYERKLADSRLTEVADDVNQAFPGAVLGNPQGSKLLVEFTDYNCGFCKRSYADVRALVAQDPEVKVIMRELPIFDGSEAAARMALAAAKQGKYAEFHDKMFEFSPANSQTARQAAQAAGLDMEQAAKDAASQEVELEIVRTRSLAEALGFGGTPSWVAGNQTFEGAVGLEELQAAVNGEEI